MGFLTGKTAIITGAGRAVLSDAPLPEYFEHLLAVLTQK